MVDSCLEKEEGSEWTETQLWYDEVVYRMEYYMKLRNRGMDSQPPL